MTKGWFYKEQGSSLESLIPKELKEIDHLMTQEEMSNKQVHPQTTKELCIL
jgi:hypothetical protein